MALQQMGIAGDQAGLVPAFPERTGAVVRMVDIADVASAECLHHATDIADIGRCDEQVNMVGHQYVSMDRAAFLLGDLIEVPQVALIIVGSEEEGLAVVAALDDVLRYAG